MKLVPSTTCDVKTWKISALSSLSAGLGFLPHPVCCFGTGGCGASVLLFLAPSSIFEETAAKTTELPLCFWSRDAQILSKFMKLTLAKIKWH